MSPEVAAIVVGVITTVGAVIVALIQRFRFENRRDHGEVSDTLASIRRTVERVALNVVHVDVKLDRHLLEHEKGLRDGTTGRRDSV